MQLTREEVLHIASLARIELTEDEMIKYQEELSNILEYVGMLQKVDTAGIEPISQITDLTNRTRPDELLRAPLAAPDSLLACSRLFDASSHEILVPPVFE